MENKTAEVDHIISWGIIGCGNVTENKSGPAFNKVNDSRLQAVMRRDGDKAADYAKRHGVPFWYSEAEALLNDPSVNAIYIATPPVFHEAYAIAALKKGKYVYVEKPVTTDIAACLRLADAVRQFRGKLTVAHYRRALPMFIQIKNLLAGNLLGKIKAIQLNLFQPHESSMIANTAFNWRVIPEYSGGGLFYDLAPHQLDIIIDLFGAPINIKGLSAHQSSFYPAEDAVSGILSFKNEILFTGNWNFNMPEFLKEDSCRIIGENGYIQFAFFGNEIQLVTDKVKEVFQFQHPQHIQQPMIGKVVNYFLGKEENPCSIEEAFKSLQVMEAFVGGRQEAI